MNSHLPAIWPLYCHIGARDRRGSVQKKRATGWAVRRAARQGDGATGRRGGYAAERAARVGRAHMSGGTRGRPVDKRADDGIS
eukprot:4123274-Alexandrium_andersonii.AAC.1